MATSLDPRTYRRRRIVVAASLGVLALLVVLATNPPWNKRDAARETAAQRATQVAATSTAGPTGDPTSGSPSGSIESPSSERAAPSEPATPVTPEACRPSDITLTPSVDPAAAFAESPVAIALSVSVSAPGPCTWTVSAETAVVKINSQKVDRAISGIENPEPGDVWTTQRCEAAISPSDLLLDPATPAPVSVTWITYPAEGSDEASHYCPGTSQWMEPGKYTVYAAALGGEPSSADFRLRPQQP